MAQPRIVFEVLLGSRGLVFWVSGERFWDSGPWSHTAPEGILDDALAVRSQVFHASEKFQPKSNLSTQTCWVGAIHRSVSELAAYWGCRERRSGPACKRSIHDDQGVSGCPG